MEKTAVSVKPYYPYSPFKCLDDIILFAVVLSFRNYRWTIDCPATIDDDFAFLIAYFRALLFEVSGDPSGRSVVQTCFIRH